MFPHRLPATLLCLFALQFCQPARADVLPPQAADAKQRLLNNPAAYDNVDNFCDGKKPGAACTLPGNTFAGGGAGVCKNEVNRTTWLIDLTCQRKASVLVHEPQLPAGGFVVEPMLCNNGLDFGEQFTCSPTTPPPPDRFCKGKKVAEACTVELANDGKKEKYPGICRQITEKASFYFQGYRTPSRDVIRCEPPQTLQRTLRRVGPLQKLTQ